MRRASILLLLTGACTDSGRTASGFDLSVQRDLLSAPDLSPMGDAAQPQPDGQSTCAPPSVAADPSIVQLGPDFSTTYSAYLLGKIPGVPGTLGGVVVKHDDPNTLLVAGNSEDPAGKIYAIGVERDGCNHIVAFKGTATAFADAPYLDANLAYGPASLLVYTEWPQFTLGQLKDGATSPSRETDLTTLGIITTNDSGPGGVGFVPDGLAAAGELRLVTWPAGHWYHVGTTLNNGLYDITSLSTPVTLDNNPGGFAYVPAGSPGFTNQSLIVSEWSLADSSLDRVAVYEVDGSGDPKPATRREFMSKFLRPWGAYFEPLTGDYLFLTWGAGDDQVYIVQGFVPPPPIP